MSDAELAVEIRAAADQVGQACALAEKEGMAVDLAISAADDSQAARAVNITTPQERVSPSRDIRMALERLNADLVEAAQRKIRVRLTTPRSGMVIVQEMWRAR